MVARVDEDAGYSEKIDTACELTPPCVTLVHAHNWLIKRNGTHSWEVVERGL